MQKIQLTLTDQEKSLLSLRAATLGYNVPRYVKFLISKEAFSVAENTPVFSLSAKAEREAEKALKEYRHGKSLELKNLEDLDEV